MFQIFVVMLLAALVAGDWNFGALVNPLKKDRSIVPQHDYVNSYSDIERFMNQFDLFPLLTSQMGNNMPMDVRESKESIDVLMDLPGVNKDDISITIRKGNELVIAAHKQGTIKTEGHSVRRMERFSGNATRTIFLPEYADLDKMEAEYLNGVLSMKIPKAHHEQEECQKTVSIK